MDVNFEIPEFGNFFKSKFIIWSGPAAQWIFLSISWSFLNNNCASVIDLCAVSMDCLESVRTFRIGNTAFSDHFPLELSIKIGKIENTHMKGLPRPRRLRWNPLEARKYKMNLEKVWFEACGSVSNVLAESRVWSITEISNCIYSVSKLSSVSKKPEFRSRWFDKKCLDARRRCFKMLNLYRKKTLISWE